MNQFQDLQVWQKARLLAKEIFLLVRKFPKNEFTLNDQMRRASVSIVSNIAEGNVRFSFKEQLHFLSIVRGSCAELETQIYICYDIGYISREEMEQYSIQVQEISKMTMGLIKSKQE